MNSYKIKCEVISKYKSIDGIYNDIIFANSEDEAKRSIIANIKSDYNQFELSSIKVLSIEQVY